MTIACRCSALWLMDRTLRAYGMRHVHSRRVFPYLAAHLETAMSETRHCWYVSSEASEAYAGSSGPTWWPQPASQANAAPSASHVLAHSSSRCTQLPPSAAHAS